MSAMKNYEKVKKLLEEHRQSRLLRFFNQLDDSQKVELLKQIDYLDFEIIDKWVAEYVKKPGQPELQHENELHPCEYYRAEPLQPHLKHKYAQAVSLGKTMIQQGRVAAFVVAGGQGTRLGFNGPKGNFQISPVKNKTLFRIFAETIDAVISRYNTICPWYIMTSPLNYHQTKEIFVSNRYFGLDKDNICIFQQGTIPVFNAKGQILLSDKDTIACSPDGHGGSIKALAQSGALEDMKRRGVELLSYWQVDNPLVNIFDELFIGLHSLDKSEMSSKAVIKTGPDEKVGNFCRVDGKIKVIEYCELPESLARNQNHDGSLVFNLASIGIHLINRSFMEKFSSGDYTLPLHRAVKQIPHLDENGNRITANGVKLESFIFDALPLAANSIILETLRNQEFAPTKNAAGVDSVDSTRRMMIERAANWLESADVKVPRKPDGSADCIIEIAPSFALKKEDVKAKRKQIPAISPGDVIYLA
jgi:UDP-N-acetylglucosamine/UDP-N-acetylgalactosamine diphosphorylase